MNVLIVFAHPESKSLNGSLKDLAVSVLSQQGHTVQVSALYQMNWKAIADERDFQHLQGTERFSYVRESKQAFADHTQSPDIEAEQAIMGRCCHFQFPMVLHACHSQRLV